MVGLDDTMMHNVARAIVAPGTDGSRLADQVADVLAYELAVGEIRRRGDQLSFHHHVPQPEGLEQDLDGGAFPPWYQWRVANWGCKWDASTSHLDELRVDPGSGTAHLSWTFETPWSPPVPWAVSAWERHCQVRLQLFCEEEGNGLLYHLECRDGSVNDAAFDCGSPDELEEYFVQRRGLDEVPQWYWPDEDEDGEV